MNNNVILPRNRSPDFTNSGLTLLRRYAGSRASDAGFRPHCQSACSISEIWAGELRGLKHRDIVHGPDRHAGRPGRLDGTGHIAEDTTSPEPEDWG